MLSLHIPFQMRGLRRRWAPQRAPDVSRLQAKLSHWKSLETNKACYWLSTNTFRKKMSQRESCDSIEELREFNRIILVQGFFVGQNVWRCPLSGSSHTSHLWHKELKLFLYGDKPKKNLFQECTMIICFIVYIYIDGCSRQTGLFWKNIFSDNWVL